MHAVRIADARGNLGVGRGASPASAKRNRRYADNTKHAPGQLDCIRGGKTDCGWYGLVRGIGALCGSRRARTRVMVHHSAALDITKDHDALTLTACDPLVPLCLLQPHRGAVPLLHRPQRGQLPVGLRQAGIPAPAAVAGTDARVCRGARWPGRERGGGGRGRSSGSGAGRRGRRAGRAVPAGGGHPAGLHAAARGQRAVGPGHAW